MIPVRRWFVLVLVGHAAAEDVVLEISTADPSFSLRGEKIDDVNEFRGIPFSAPRTPPNRFQLPVDYEHTAGEIYDATDQKDHCVNDTGGGSEDCLYLDVYMPGACFQANCTKPVLVWIHGGAWRSGSKNEYSGVLWASQNWTDDVDRVVVVTVNYRMNILGFPDMDGVPRNLAMHDNIQALKWVKMHISNFGGDPESITIFGESAGAMQVVQLWSSPAQRVRGLFHRAIAQSPYIWNYRDGTKSPVKFREAKRQAQADCMALACDANDTDDADGTDDADDTGDASDTGDANCTLQSPSLAQMRRTRCFGNATHPARWYGAMSDGDLISDTFHRDWCGHMEVGYGVPLLVGHNSLEINYWSQIALARQSKETDMRNWIDALAPTSDGEAVFRCLGDLYEASGRMQDPAFPNRDEPAEDIRDLYATTGVFLDVISQTLAQLPNVHLFLFDESAKHSAEPETEWPPGSGEFLGLGFWDCHNPRGGHACELPFVITDVEKYNATGDNVGGGEDMNVIVQRNMRKAWASFAKSGNPGWADDEVGVFMEGRVDIRERSAAVSRDVSNMLTSLMCHPSTVMDDCPPPRTATSTETSTTTETLTTGSVADTTSTALTVTTATASTTAEITTAGNTTDAATETTTPVATSTWTTATGTTSATLPPTSTGTSSTETTSTTSLIVVAGVLDIAVDDTGGSRRLLGQGRRLRVADFVADPLSHAAAVGTIAWIAGVPDASVTGTWDEGRSESARFGFGVQASSTGPVTADRVTQRLTDAGMEDATDVLVAELRNVGAGYNVSVLSLSVNTQATTTTAAPAEEDSDDHNTPTWVYILLIVLLLSAVGCCIFAGVCYALRNHIRPPGPPPIQDPPPPNPKRPGDQNPDGPLHPIQAPDPSPAPSPPPTPLPDPPLPAPPVDRSKNPFGAGENKIPKEWKGYGQLYQS